MTKEQRKKVLVIGWDAADWKVINPLMDQGAMPHLASLVEQGVMAEISTLHPVLSPMLWTSIATGKRAFKHGIYGFIEPNEDGMSVRPITNLSRKTKAVWNIANQNDLRSIVVGWWPSHPAEPIRGAMVSNEYQRIVTPSHEDPWPVKPGSVHPPELSDALQEIRVHPSELEEDVMRMFIPKAGEIDQDKDRRLWVCATQICEATNIQSAATFLMEQEEWDLAAVYFDAIDHFSHAFMKYHPPRREDVAEHEFELFQHVVRCAYIYHDMMLGAMLNMIDDDTTVIVVSDHGFHPDHLRPKDIPKEPAGPAIEHREYGIFVIKGPGIKQDELIHGVNLLDVAPTILTALGLPVGEDMDGRVIADAFEQAPEIDPIPSWDDIPGDSGQHPPERQLDAGQTQEALQQLVDLGYVEPLDDDQEKNVSMATDELDYNLARAYMDAHRFVDAVPLLYGLFCRKPSEYRYGIQLAMCFKALQRYEDLGALTERLKQQRFADAAKARDELQNFRQLAEKRREERLINIGEFNPDLAGKELEKEDFENLPEELKGNLFSTSEMMKINQLMGLAQVNQYALDFLSGYANVNSGKMDEGIEELQRSIDAEPSRPGLYLQLGDAYLKLRDWPRAMQAFEEAIKLDADEAQSWFGIGRCHLGLKQNTEAAEMLLKSVGQAFFNPLAHYYLGIAFHRMKRFDDAIDALKLSISQNPNNAQAYGRLGHIYKHAKQDLASAKEFYQLALDARNATRELRRNAREYELPEFDEQDNSALHNLTVESLEVTNPENVLPTLAQLSLDEIREREPSSDPKEVITVVTGLPRTGTSMMMQMLSNGGLPPMTDELRTADLDNPRGYYELEAVKSLSKDNRWVKDAKGKVVKVVLQLLPYLPKDLNYQVVFMDRAMDEVLASQQTMLDRNEKAGGNLGSEQLRKVFLKQARTAVEMLKRAKIKTIRIPYADTIEDPQKTAEHLAEFFDGEMDIAKMAESVDASLYRQKKPQSSAS